MTSCGMFFPGLGKIVAYWHGRGAEPLMKVPYLELLHIVMCLE